jgi:protein TonB
MPEFPGGEADMMKYLKKNIRYPGQALAENITGTVYLSFIINTEGKVSQVKILKGIGGGCEEEAVRVVKSMPVWEPGKQNGNPVNVQLTLPVSFKTR